MRSIILAATLTFGSLPAFANQCNIELNGQLQLEDKVLQVQIDHDNQLTITEDKVLYVNNQEIDLSNEQRQWVNQYYNGINEAVPQAANIATDAIALANSAMSEVFEELLGSDSQVMQDLSDKLNELDQQVQYNFYGDNGNIQIDSDAFEDRVFMGEQWEQEFEQAIEEVVSESIGHVLVALGTQIIFGGGDLEEFEHKMEHFGQRIEHKIEAQAKVLEKNAHALCITLAEIDMAENKLQQNIQQLSNLDVLQVKNNTNLM
ncbi:MAG: YggN family protein [Paraglaciecola sp.]|uniref:YggN family protein n=1 Tax=Paraglaciecola sp. TaxID=1920173 RepID=UPI0032999724